MGWFWLTAGALVLASAVALMRGLRRGRAAPAPGAQDMQVYRDQLAEIERDMARGVIAAEEAARLRTEVSRRILEADRMVQAGAGGTDRSTTGPALLLPALLVIAVLAGGAALYWRLGAPGYPDMPLAERIAMAETLRSTRPDQAKAEAGLPAAVPPEGMDAEFLALMDKLRSAVRDRPGDVQGQRLLAQNEARLGNFAAAHAAQAQVIALSGAAATAEDHAALAELLVFAAGGYVSPEAEAALTEALRRDPQNGTARYYSGLMFAQTGRPDRAFLLWRDLLESSPPDAPWVAAIRAQIGDLSVRAGVRYSPAPQPGLAGPSAADMEAAAGMATEDRAAMIEGMVAQLNDRLATEGGTAAEWAQLIGAYGVLGQTERARQIWAEAQGRFAARPEDLAVVRTAAEAAGVAP